MSEIQTIVGGGDARSLSEVSQKILATLNYFKNRSSDAQLVETGTSGSSWYRVWSDGFKEMGLTVARTGSGAETTTLPKTMSTTTYQITTVPLDATNYFGYGDGLMVIGSRTRTSFTHYSKSGKRNYAVIVMGF